MPWREMNRLQAGQAEYVERLPALIWGGLILGTIAFWGLAGIGAVTVWQWVTG